MNLRTMTLAAAFLLLCCARAAQPTPEAKRYPVDAAPPQLAERVARADAAIGELQKALGTRLFTELEKGAVPAVEVCNQEAPAIAARVAQEKGVEVGRTSHKLRNPNNAPRDWARAEVAAAAGKKASEVQPLVFDLGDRVGVLRPIPLGAACMQCHGPDIAPEVKQALDARYPEDQARGFQEGDLRGFFWAEVR